MDIIMVISRMEATSSKWTHVVVALTVCYLSLPVRGNVWWPCSNECVRCLRQTTPFEELLIQYYPGLFSISPPSYTISVSGGQHFGDRPLYSRSAQIHHRDPSDNQHGSKLVVENSHEHDTKTTFSPPGNNPDSVNSNKISESSRNQTEGTEGVFGLNVQHPPPRASFVWSGASMAAAVRGYPKKSLSPPCCETVQEYVTPPNVTVEGKVYRVVHLRQAFQFIPVAKCRQGTTCSHGECVERYRAHWVLVYNTTKSHGQPPVSFTPVEVPSHCECLNVGRP